MWSERFTDTEREKETLTQSKDRSNYICGQVQRQKHRHNRIDLV